MQHECHDVLFSIYVFSDKFTQKNLKIRYHHHFGQPNMLRIEFSVKNFLHESTSF